MTCNSGVKYPAFGAMAVDCTFRSPSFQHVLQVVQSLGKHEFTLAADYAHTAALAKLHSSSVPFSSFCFLVSSFQATSASSPSRLRGVSALVAPSLQGGILTLPTPLQPAALAARSAMPCLPASHTPNRKNSASSAKTPRSS